MKILLFIFLLLSGTSIVAQNSTVFQAIPVSINNTCQSTLLRPTEGSNASKTAFLLPKAVLGVNSLGEKKFQIIQLKNGTYELLFSIYFPANNKELRLKDGSKILPMCYIENLTAEFKKANNIDQIAHMIMSNIEITIPELGTYRIAPEGTTVLDYLQGYRNVKFKIGDRDALETFLGYLRSPSGIEVGVNFKFMSRRSDGKIFCDIDGNMAAQKLAAAAKVPVKAVNVSAKTTFTNILKEVSTNCFMEASTDDGFNKMALDMAKDASSWWQKSIDQYSGSTSSKANACAINPESTDCFCTRYPSSPRCPGTNTSDTPSSTLNPDILKACQDASSSPADIKVCYCTQDPSNSACTDSMSVVGNDSSSADMISPDPFPKTEHQKTLALMELDLLADFFKSKGKIKYNFERVAVEKSESYNTSIVITANDKFGDWLPLRLAAQETSNNILVKNFGLEGGQKVDTNNTGLISSNVNTIVIYPRSEKITTYIYPEVKKYFSKTDLQTEADVDLHFPTLAPLDIGKLEEKNGKAYFVPQYYWKENVVRALFMPTFMQMFKDINWRDEVRWGTFTRKQIVQSDNVVKKIILRSIDDVYALPIGISFSEISEKIFKLNDPELKDLVTIEFMPNSGTFSITANENLGEVAIFSLSDINSTKIYPIRHFEEKTKVQVFSANEVKITFSKNENIENVPMQARNLELSYKTKQTSSLFKSIESILINTP